MRSRLRLALVASCLLLACGPRRPPAAEPAPPRVAPERFDEMSHQQQERFMARVVVPAMGSIFREHDRERHADFDCASCHGSRAARHEFEMPNPELPALDPTDSFAKHRAEDASMVEFMMKQVTPEMARLLKEPLFDPATGTGFGCGGCHTIAHRGS